MACNFIKIGSSNTSCKESFSGVGSTIYAFTKSDLDDANLKPAYSDLAAEYVATSFAGLKVAPIMVKAQTGQVTATNNPDGGGFQTVYTGRVANDVYDLAAMARVMNNRADWGLLVPTGKTNEQGLRTYYVIYDPSFDTLFELSYDTGNTPDSDHGHTLTVTCGPMLYPAPTWTPASEDADIVEITQESYTESIVGE